MTPSYWFRIVLGAFAIFAVGMLATAGLREGRGRVVELVDGSGPVTVPLLGLAFRLDGHPVGGIERVRMLRSAPRRIDSVVVVVKLANAASVAQLAGCTDLMVQDAEHVNENTSFTCVDSAATHQPALVRFGHVELVPDGRTIAIWVPETMVADLQGASVGAGAANDTGNVEIEAADRAISVEVNGRRVAAQAGDSSPAIEIRDGAGRTVVKLREPLPEPPAAPPAAPRP